MAGGGAGLRKRRGRGGEEKGREGKWREGKGGPPKLLLNQGPSEPCYATAWNLPSPVKLFPVKVINFKWSHFRIKWDQTGRPN